MNLGGISVAVGLVTLGLVTAPYGLAVIGLLVFIYLKS